MIGVNTGKLFGHYHYSNIMGEKLNGVPFLIGINWFVTIFCVGVLLTYISDWVEEKYMQMGVQLKPWTLVFSFVFDGALLATMLDYTMEPVATKLNFWKWKGDSIPDYNYLCWFVISALLFFLFKKMNFNKQNQFAVHLLIVQFLFFFTLKIYLQ